MHTWNIAKCPEHRGVLFTGVFFKRGSTVSANSPTQLSNTLLTIYLLVLVLPILNGSEVETRLVRKQQPTRFLGRGTEDT